MNTGEVHLCSILPETKGLILGLFRAMHGPHNSHSRFTAAWRVLLTDSSHFYVPHYCLNGIILYFTQSILPRVDQVWWAQIMSCLRHRRHMHGLIPWLFVSRVVCGHVCLYIYVFMCIHVCAHAHNFVPTQLTRRGETCPTSDGVYQRGEENHWQCLLKDV